MVERGRRGRAKPQKPRWRRGDGLQAVHRGFTGLRDAHVMETERFRDLGLLGRSKLDQLDHFNFEYYLLDLCGTLH